MDIIINQQKFSFKDNSNIETEQFQVTITERGFNEKKAMIRAQFVSTPVFFPEFIERRIKRTTFKPLTTIYYDDKENMKLETEF